MTSPVTTAPHARPAAAGSTASGADSAEPFATALDGAMATGRGEVDDAGPDSGQQEPEQDGTGEGAAAQTVPVSTEVAAGSPGIVAALWARLTGAVGGGDTAPGDATPGAPGAATSTGRARALEVASAQAQGLRGLPLGQTPAGGPGAAPGGPAPAVPPPGSPVPPVPTATGPVLPPPVPAVAEAAAALAAAGVQVVVAPADAAAPAVAATLPPASPGAAPVPAVPAAPDAAPDADGGVSPAPSNGTGTVPSAVPPVAGAPSRGDAGTGRPPSDQASAEAAPVSSTAAGPAPSAVAAAPRAEAATGPAAAQPVAEQLSRPVALLRGGPDGTHSMTVVLTPENLGPVEVSVTLSKGTVELTLRGAHDHGRAALIDALPDLRRDLEAAGLTCSRVDVDRGGRDARDGSWSGSQSSWTGGRDGGRGAPQDRGETGARPWHRPADNEEGHPARSRSVSGLDVRV